VSAFFTEGREARNACAESFVGGAEGQRSAAARCDQGVEKVVSKVARQREWIRAFVEKSTMKKRRRRRVKSFGQRRAA